MIVVAKRIHQISEYFFSEKMKEIQTLENKGIDIINLGIGNPDILPPYGVIPKMKKASEIKNANTYQSYIGIESLRKSIADWYGNTYKVDVDYQKEVLPLMGSKEGIMDISLSYLNKGNQVLIPNPGYPIYSSISKLLESEVIYYDLYDREDWCPNIKLLENKNLSKVKIMWINYPHMPTGATITFEKLEEIVVFAKKNRILLVHDNPYSLILNNNQRPLSIFNIKGSKDIALELNSLSKSYNMAGWRIGMIIGKHEYIKNILKVKSLINSGMYYPIQIGAIAAMNQNSEWFKKLNLEYLKRKKIILEICDRLYLKYRRKSSGIFVWAKILDLEQNDRKWSDKILKNYHIFITPGSIFGNNGKGYVRLSMCCPVKTLEKAKNRIFS
ncbi:aminotransferase [Blattabacterium punctulatus]|uniref:pyridoxal phosphate-dependent aminotransferase n=1 Tax=Blattabacterium punctulatus TaxID=164514 RepID=UPI000D7C02C1|nr:aminotransferase class I/II-fold pyridoxal phosphate-dependent enzyme [Blattabacterium punctulatus]AWU43207.1 aminotransferase [Blattabacterium punctulatus]